MRKAILLLLLLSARPLFAQTAPEGSGKAMTASGSTSPATDRPGRGHAAGQILLASRARRALHQRSHMHMALANFYLPASPAPKCPPTPREDSEKSVTSKRRHRLAEAFRSTREGSACSVNAQGPRAAKCTLKIATPPVRRHVSPHHRSCQRAHGPARRLRPHAGVTPTWSKKE